MSGRAGWVVHGRESAFPVCPPQVGQVLAGEHGRQLGDASTVDADLAVPDLPGQNDTPAARCVAAFSVLDAPAAHPPQVPVVEDRAVGNQQLEHGVIELDVHGDLTGWDVRGAQVQNGVPAVGPHLELAGGGPVAQALGHLVVRGDPDRCGWGGRCGVHRSVPLWNRATTHLVVSYDYPYSTIQCQLFVRTIRPDPGQHPGTSRPRGPRQRRYHPADMSHFGPDLANVGELVWPRLRKS